MAFSSKATGLQFQHLFFSHDDDLWDRFSHDQVEMQIC